MWGRFKHWLFLFGIAVTQGIINVTIAGLWWVITGNGAAPDPDEAFSSRIGRYAMQGKRWALVMEKVIDRIFGAGHCRQSAAYHAMRCD
jgi:hypothetical protein